MWEVPFLPGLGYPHASASCIAYPIIAVHWEHSHPEVPPLSLSPHSLSHVLCSASLATIQHQQPPIICHAGVCKPVPYGWNGLKTVVLSQHMKISSKDRGCRIKHQVKYRLESSSASEVCRSFITLTFCRQDLVNHFSTPKSFVKTSQTSLPSPKLL